MPKVKDGRKEEPPKVRRSARDDRPTSDADELAELRADNAMLRLQLQKARRPTLTSEQVPSTTSAPDEQVTASFATFVPLDATQKSSALHSATTTHNISQSN